VDEPPATAPASHGVEVSLEAVSHRYDSALAVDDVSLRIRGGELVVLLGPSGCGKTTLLRIVAGLIRQSAGRLCFADKIVDALPPSERGAGIVFQNYALFPHMNVAANIGYGLRARGATGGSIKATVARMLNLVQMEGFAERFPRELSGGQQQRVALARTMAVNPHVLLLDEPFGALDKNLRLDMQIEIKRIQRELGITTIMVTHDQEEALGMAERIAVMNQGRIEQFGTPDAVYHAPESIFVASFVGTANLVPATLTRKHAGWSARLQDGSTLSLPQARPHNQEGDVTLVIRPEHFSIHDAAADGIPASLEAVLPQGPATIFELRLGTGSRAKAMTGGSVPGRRPMPGSYVRLQLSDDARVSVFAR